LVGRQLGKQGRGEGKKGAPGLPAATMRGAIGDRLQRAAKREERGKHGVPDKNTDYKSKKGNEAARTATGKPPIGKGTPASDSPRVGKNERPQEKWKVGLYSREEKVKIRSKWGTERMKRRKKTIVGRGRGKGRNSWRKDHLDTGRGVS